MDVIETIWGTEVNLEMPEGSAIFINTDTVLTTKDTFYVKFNAEIFATMCRGKKIIFFENKYYTAEQIIGTSRAAKRIKILRDAGLKFKIVFLLPQYCSPNWEYFEQEKKGIIIGNGKAEAMVEDSILVLGKGPDFNLAHNLGWEFTSINIWLSGKKIEAVENKYDFLPAEFFETKKKMYYTYAPNIETYVVNVPEVLYIAGPPSMGKTVLSRYVAHKWGYIRIYDKSQLHNLEAGKSYVVDINPVSITDFPGATRIFLVGETDLGLEGSRLLSSHLLLAMKKYYIMQGKTIKYDLYEVDEYFKINARFPAVKLIKLDYVPYQFYNMKKYEKFLGILYKFLM